MGFNRGIGWFGTQHVSFFIMTFSNVNGLSIGDIHEVATWNAFFDLPEKGDVFKDITVDGNVVTLYDSQNITIVDLSYQFLTLLRKLSISVGCSVTLGHSAFADTYATSFNIENIKSIGANVFGQSVVGVSPIMSFTLKGISTLPSSTFSNQPHIVSLDIPDVINLGETTGDDGVFASISGESIFLRIKSSLMTCNGGDPDGDIQSLQSNNIVTIATVQ